MSFVTVANLALVTAAEWAATAAVVGSVAGVAGQVINGQMQSQAAQQQARIAAANHEAQAQANEYQATVARLNADAAHAQANQQEEAQRRKFRMLQGEAMAGIAQSGTGFDGSNAGLLEQNSLFNEMDALNVRYQGEMQARGLLSQAEMETWNAKLNRQNAGNDIATGNMTASAATTGAAFSAGAGLMSGLSGAYTTYKLAK